MGRVGWVKETGCDEQQRHAAAACFDNSWQQIGHCSAAAADDGSWQATGASAAKPKRPEPQAALIHAHSEACTGVRRSSKCQGR